MNRMHPASVRIPGLQRGGFPERVRRGTPGGGATRDAHGLGQLSFSRGVRGTPRTPRGDYNLGAVLTYYRHLNGHTLAVPEFRPELLAEPGSLHWVDLEDATEAEARILTEAFRFHPLAVEDCLSDVNLPKVDDYTDYVFLVVHGIRFDAPTDQFETREREILHRLSRGEFRVVSPKAAVYFRDIYDSLYRIVDASYSYQDMAQGTLDAYLSAINNRLNETMKRLTVLTVVLASLTVITGVYGMNFEHMPELGWRFGYLWALALMVVVPGAIVVWARRKKWL